MLDVSGARALVALGAALLAACAGNGEGLDANGQPLGSAGGTPPPLTADFQSIQDNVFTPVCVHCHSGAGAPQGLQLDAAHSYALLVGVPSNEEPGLLRVQPGVPGSSYNRAQARGQLRNRRRADAVRAARRCRSPRSTSFVNGSATAPPTPPWPAPPRRASQSWRASPEDQALVVPPAGAHRGGLQR